MSIFLLAQLLFHASVLAEMHLAVQQTTADLQKIQIKALITTSEQNSTVLLWTVHEIGRTSIAAK
jgi:hypothetical protein